jgi:hypothetical protein
MCGLQPRFRRCLNFRSGMLVLIPRLLMYWRKFLISYPLSTLSLSTLRLAPTHTLLMVASAQTMSLRLPLDVILVSGSPCLSVSSEMLVPYREC